jgi:hypothetical protein
MTCRHAAAGIAVAVVAALALGACGGSAQSVPRHDVTTTRAATTGAPISTTTGHVAAAPVTAAHPRVTPGVAAALERQLSAVTGELSVANSAIAQADVDAAKSQEGSQP